MKIQRLSQELQKQLLENRLIIGSAIKPAYSNFEYKVAIEINKRYGSGSIVVKALRVDQYNSSDPIPLTKSFKGVLATIIRTSLQNSLPCCASVSPQFS